MKLRLPCWQLSKGQSVLLSKIQKDSSSCPLHRSSTNTCINPNVVPSLSTRRQGEGGHSKGSQTPERLPLPP